MALNFYCAFTVDGSALSGDAQVSEVGGIDVSSDHIECYEVNFGTSIGDEPRRRRGRHEIAPVILLHRHDQTSPLLYRALAQNQRLDGDIKVFEPDPDTGETRHRFTVRLSNARIVSVETLSPDLLDMESVPSPLLDRIEIVPRTIAFIDEVNSVEFEDSAG